MKNLLSLIIILTLAFPSLSKGQEYLGFWNGEVQIGDAWLRVNYEIENSDSLRVWFTSPDQGQERYQCDVVKIEGDSVILGLTKYQTTFRGLFDKRNNVIQGSVFNGSLELPLTLSRNRIDKRIKPRPQNPVPPYPYTEIECVFNNTSANIQLSGTLTIPQGKGPFPCAILISGSGAQDRNETLADHQPFMVLADHLTRNGIAVLRYDDRGVGGSGGNVVSATSADFAGDALAAYRFLQSRKDIHKQKIGLIGHSEGGLVAPIAAMKEPGIAFIISMAGPGIKGYDILVDQTIDIEIREGVSRSMAEGHAKDITDVLDIVAQESDSVLAAQKIMKHISESKADMALLMDDFESYKLMNNTFFNNPWMRFFAFFDPAQAWSSVKCPVLAINGSLDLQVRAEKNLNAIARSLESGGNRDYSTMIFQGLNHLFQPTETGRISEYQNIETTIDPDVLLKMSTWINERMK